MKDPNYLKAFVRGAYDLQKMRMQTGNRICAEWREQNGQKSGEKQEELSDEAKITMDVIKRSYSRLTDGLVNLPTAAKFDGDEVISSYTMLCLVDQYIQMEKDEARHFRRMGKILEDYPIWTEFMQGVCGVGPAMAGVIISEIDIHKATYPSSLFRYAGLDVAPNDEGVMAGRSRKKWHLEESEYEDSEGNIKKKKGITFNPFLKTKLVGVLGTSFLKQKPERCKYRQVYDDYKNRITNMPAHKDKSKGHRHNMAIRYCVKQFLIDLYMEWRPLEGLDVYGTYAEEKLGIHHKKQPRTTKPRPDQNKVILQKRPYDSSEPPDERPQA